MKQLNFHAKVMSVAINKIENLSYELACHTILLITYPDSKSINHWRSEILSWLNSIKSYNKVKTPSGKLSKSKVAGIIYEQELGLITDVENTYRSVVGDELGIAGNKVDINNVNFDNYMISLGAIYDDYIDYIYNDMSQEELISRMEKYYLYDGR